MIDVKMLARAFAFAASIPPAGAPAWAKEPGHAIDPGECTEFLKAGEASHYGEEVAIDHDKNGNPIFNKTASGEKFSPWAMAAAYRDRELFGEFVKVVMKNPVEGKEEDVIVKVNDLGPFANDKKGKPRVIDLTTGAANTLGMDGVAQVTIYKCS